jgi:C-terminal processing protease CtpA/Prc
MMLMRTCVTYSGVTLDSNVDKGINGAQVTSIATNRAIAIDGRLNVGDLIVKINGEIVRNATASQTRAILHRASIAGAPHCQ